MKGIMYKKYVRSALSYGAECWAMKVEDVRRIKSTEMRMLRMISGKTVRDKERNKEIRERTEVESINEHLREQCLRWFCHMERMDCERPQVSGNEFQNWCSKKDRSKNRRKEVIDVDMKIRGLKRSEWCSESNALETWLQKPAYPCIRGQQTGLQANDDWSKMKKKKM